MSIIVVVNFLLAMSLPYVMAMAGGREQGSCHWIILPLNWIQAFVVWGDMSIMPLSLVSSHHLNQVHPAISSCSANT